VACREGGFSIRDAGSPSAEQGTGANTGWRFQSLPRLTSQARRGSAESFGEATVIGSIPVMNKQLLTAILSFLIAAAGAIAETVKGPCTLIFDDRGKTISKHVEFGAVVKGKCDFKLMPFGGSTAIIANGEFLNTSDKNVSFAYYVSFFDKEDNLVGSASFVYADKDTALAPGKSIRSGSCIIKIPDSIRDKVASYQATLYVLEQPGRKKP